MLRCHLVDGFNSAQLRVPRAAHANGEHANIPETCATGTSTGGGAAVSEVRDLLWSLEDVFLPTEHGKSLKSRALTPGLWTI